MTKLGSIVHYEILMAWRRRSLVIMSVLLLAGVIGIALLIISINQQNSVVMEVFSQDRQVPIWMFNTIAIVNIMLSGMIVSSVGVTLMMSETIPLDRQFKVRELLDTLPISRVTYLGGKLLGVWGGLFLVWGVIGVTAGIALYLILGAYDLRVFLLLWVVMFLPTMFMAAALSVLASALVGSRRMAVIIGLVVLPFVMIFAGMGMPAFISAAALINPIYVFGILSLLSDLTNTDILNRIASVLLQYAGVTFALWTFVWMWMRVREAR